MVLSLMDAMGERAGMQLKKDLKASEHSIIGKPMPRVDAVPKVTGAARYVGDISFPQMLHGKILRSPHPHARIAYIDTTKAERLPGVKAVITGERDTRGVRYGIFPRTRDEYALAMDRVRYIGDEVAAVAAVDEDTAEQAVELIEVDYEVLPPVFDPREAMQEDAPQLHEHIPGNRSVVTALEYGDVQKAFDTSDYVREDHFDTSALTHCLPECYGAVATCDPSGYVDVWVNNQSPFIKQKMLSSTMKIPEQKIRLHRPYLGAAFGSQSEMLKAEFIAAMLARKTNRPVRVFLSREETNAGSVRQKHAFHMDLRTGVTEDGILKVMSFQVVSDGGAYISIGAITNICGVICLLGMYPRLEAFRYHCDRVCTNNPPKGAMRGNGAQQIQFAVESQIDLIARDLGLDPVALRIKNAARTGDVNIHKSVITSSAFEETLTEARESAGWKARFGKSSPFRGIGVGCGSYFHSFDYGYRTASAAIIKFNEEGQVTLFSGNVDNGSGNETMLVAVAAEELGVPFEDVRLVNGDTLLTPTDPGSHSMSSTTTSAMAVKLAAADARQQVFEIAAEEMEANVEDLRSGDGKIFVTGSPRQGIYFKHAIVAGLMKGRIVVGRGNYQPSLDPVNWYAGQITGQMVGAYSYATTIAEVEIDSDTGVVRVPKLTVALDCGKPLNPQVVHGSIQGSTLYCLGQALYEEASFNKGQMMNPTYLDYVIPSSMEMPEIETIIVDAEHGDGPFGAKGLDAPVNAVNAAIANAVEDAIGIRIRELPITPEKVLKALEEKGHFEKKQKVH